MDVQQVVSLTNEKVLKWKRNFFMLPSVKTDKDYIDECTGLLPEWVYDSQLQRIAIIALIIMQS